MEAIQMTMELAKVHGAPLTAVYVLEVPFSLPLETALPQRLAPAYDSGDNLHPNPAGYRAMANAIPLSLFKLPATSAGPRR